MSVQPKRWRMTPKLTQVRELEQLIMLNRKIAMQVDLDGVLQAIVDCARELIGAQMGGLVVADSSDSHQLRHFKVSGVPPTHQLPAGHGLFMVPYRTGKPVRIESLKPTVSALQPPDHPPLGPFLGVPLKSGATILGSLFLAEAPGGRPFRHRDQDLLGAFADQVAIAIDSAQTRDQLARLLVLEERERISHTLHASVAQNLFLLKLEIERFRAAAGLDFLAAASHLDTMLELAETSLKDVRTAIYSLSDSLFRGQRISVTLRRMVEEFQRASGIDTKLIIHGNDSRLTEEMNLAIAQIVEESLNNIRKHSQSPLAVISLIVDSQSVAVAVQDAGVGLPSDLEIRMESGSGFGIRAMQSLAAKLFGTFQVLINDEGGTTVRASIPCPSPV